MLDWQSLGDDRNTNRTGKQTGTEELRSACWSSLGSRMVVAIGSLRRAVGVASCNATLPRVAGITAT